MVRPLALQFVIVALLVNIVSFVSCEDYWEKFDAEKSGSVNAAKLKEGFKKENIELSDEQVAEIIHVADFNNDGTISQIEFNLKVVPYFTFKKFDKDNNGHLTKDELPSGFQKDEITLKPERTEEIFEVADENHDGHITYREFVYRVFPYYKFVKFDKDGCGGITKEELKTGFTALEITVSDDTLDHVFKIGDINHDSKITYTEFVLYVQQFFYFAKADKNHNGSVSSDEMKESFKDHGIVLTDEKLRELAKIADSNNNENFNYREFLYNIYPYFRFIRFDKNGDGEITKEEFKEGLKPHGIVLDDERFDALFQLGDSNRDNTISYVEFLYRIDPFWTFRIFDKSNNGGIDKEELKEGFRLHGVTLTTAQHDTLYEIGDVDKVNHISYEQYLYEVYTYFKFRRFDKDKSDSIDKEELGEGLKFYGYELTEAELTSLFSIANGNTNNPIDYKKFLSKINPYFRFRKLDTDKSDSVDSAELVEGSKLFGRKLNKTEADKLIQEAAKAGQTSVKYSEYLTIDPKIN